MIRQISNEAVIKEGVYQAFYKEEDFEILVSRINKGVILDEHKHEHEQFGFCFNGKFNFIVENKEYFLEKNMSYLIKKNLTHSASSSDDFYALDFKYIDRAQVKLSPLSGIISAKEIEIHDLTLGKHKLFKVTSKIEFATIQLNRKSDIDYFLVVGEQLNIQIEENKIELYPMKIYKINSNTDDELLLKIIDSNKDLLIIQICRKDD